MKNPVKTTSGLYEAKIDIPTPRARLAALKALDAKLSGRHDLRKLLRLEEALRDAEDLVAHREEARKLTESPSLIAY